MAIPKKEFEAFLKQASELEDRFILQFQDNFIDEFLAVASLSEEDAREVRRLFDVLGSDSRKHYRILENYYNIVAASNKYEF